MLNRDSLRPRKIVNGFYIREKKHSSLRIGRQKMDAERVYMYLYNMDSRKHEGRWCYPDVMSEKNGKDNAPDICRH